MNNRIGNPRRAALRLVITAEFLFAAFFFTACDPPTIVTFRAIPRNACPDTEIGLTWEIVDGRDAHVTASPPTGEDLSVSLPAGPGTLGLRFRVGHTDTTFTLIAHRSFASDQTATAVVHVVPNPFPLALTLGYDCNRGSWLTEAVSREEYANTLLVRSIYNDEDFEISVHHGGSIALVIPPHGDAVLAPPTGLTTGDWQVYRHGGGVRVPCPEPGVINTGPAPPTPPPVHIIVISTCPP